MMNQEVIICLQPDRDASATTTMISSKEHKEENYRIRRMRHSAGDVTCVSFDEYVSLPTDAIIAIQYHAVVAAQAYLSIVKQ